MDNDLTILTWLTYNLKVSILILGGNNACKSAPFDMWGQLVQNAAATRYQHVTPVLLELPWLLVVFWTQFKVLLIAYKVLYRLGQEHLKKRLTLQLFAQLLRYSGRSLLRIPPPLEAGLLLVVRERERERAFSRQHPGSGTLFPSMSTMHYDCMMGVLFYAGALLYLLGSCSLWMGIFNVFCVWRCHLLLVTLRFVVDVGKAGYKHNR